MLIKVCRMENYMESEILITDELSTVQLKQLAQLINDCNGYEPYYNCGYKHFLYYTKGTLAGFLSYIPDDTTSTADISTSGTSNNTLSAKTLFCEITALVHPQCRCKGILKKLIAYAKTVFPYYAFYGQLPDFMSEQSDIYFSEYLMSMTYDSYIVHSDTNNTKCITNAGFDNTGSFNNIRNTDNITDCNNSRNKNDNTSLPLEFYFSDDCNNYFAYIKDSDEPVCVCSLDYEPSFTNIYGVFTEPGYRNQKIAYKMLENLIYEYFADDELSDKHTKSLILNVRSTNAPAIHLYRKCGFKIEDSVNYYLI